MLQFPMQRLQATREDEREDFSLAYDSICNLNHLRAARKLLPLPQPYNNIWLKINKVIDQLHIILINFICKTKYSSDLLKEKIPGLNTPVAEQTFVWAAKVKKIMCAMPKCHQLFYYHRMVIRWNAYTSSCYKANRDPNLSKIHGEVEQQ
jgi:hypothetical protein